MASLLTAPRLGAYGACSVLAAAVVLIQALSARSNAYAAMIALARSPGAVFIFANLGIAQALGLARVVQVVFFGPLRTVEVDRLSERMWYTLTESLLAATIFRKEFDLVFAVLLGFTLLLKAFHLLVESRVEYMEQVDTLPRLFHIRLVSFQVVLFWTDILLLALLNLPVRSPSDARLCMMAMYGCDMAVLLATLLTQGAKYVLNVLESQRNGAPWERKAMYVFLADLLLDSIKMGVYINFMSLIVPFHVIPFYLIRDMYLTGRSICLKIRDTARYRAATRNMDDRYPTASSEDIANMSDGICIICRETLTAPEDVNPASDTDTGGDTHAASAPLHPNSAAASESAPSGLSEGTPPVDDITAQTTLTGLTRVHNRVMGADGLNYTPKKLGCGHIFHYHCLRAWLERQQSCPTCRRTVFQDPTAATTATEPAAAPPAVGGNAGAEANADTQSRGNDANGADDHANAAIAHHAGASAGPATGLSPAGVPPLSPDRPSGSTHPFGAGPTRPSQVAVPSTGNIDAAGIGRARHSEHGDFSVDANEVQRLMDQYFPRSSHATTAASPVQFPSASETQGAPDPKPAEWTRVTTPSPPQIPYPYFHPYPAPYSYNHIPQSFLDPIITGHPGPYPGHSPGHIHLPSNQSAQPPPHTFPAQPSSHGEAGLDGDMQVVPFAELDGLSAAQVETLTEEDWPVPRHLRSYPMRHNGPASHPCSERSSSHLPPESGDKDVLQSGVPKSRTAMKNTAEMALQSEREQRRAQKQKQCSTEEHLSEKEDMDEEQVEPRAMAARAALRRYQALERNQTQVQTLARNQQQTHELTGVEKAGCQASSSAALLADSALAGPSRLTALPSAPRSAHGSAPPFAQQTAVGEQNDAVTTAEGEDAKPDYNLQTVRPISEVTVDFDTETTATTLLRIIQLEKELAELHPQVSPLASASFLEDHRESAGLARGEMNENKTLPLFWKARYLRLLRSERLALDRLNEIRLDLAAVKDRIPASYRDSVVAEHDSPFNVEHGSGPRSKRFLEEDEQKGTMPSS